MNKSFGLTDPGPVRGNNEDAIHFDDERGIYFVVDGMGGHAAGEQAAAIASERLIGRLERPTGTPEQRVREAITLANEAILDAAEKRPEWRGMACVLTVALVTNGTATVGHVGDSRLYKVTRGALRKITRDHSPVGELEDTGVLSEAQAMSHPRRNEVYRDVGSDRRDADDPDFIDTYEVPFEEDAALLLCSDGLSDALPSATIHKVILGYAADGEGAVEALVNAAKEDGKDNISAILVEGPAFPAAPQRKKRKAARAPVMPPAVPRSVPEVGPAAPAIEAPAAITLVRRADSWWARVWFALLGAAIGMGATLFAIYGIPPGMPTALTQAPPAHVPRTLTVGADFATVEEAMEAAQAGDTVVLATRAAQPIRLKSGVTLRGPGMTVTAETGGKP